MLLEGKKVIIIGGSSGIGFATAINAVTEGAEVVIASRSLDKLKDAQQRIGSSSSFSQLDLCDTKMVQSFFENLGKFDHLLIPGSQCNAGPFLSLETDVARATFESKFWGAYRAVKFAAPYINEDGSVTLFSGRLSRRPGGLSAALLASVNSAVEGLGRGLAFELAPIRVNTVSPGLTNTELFNSLGETEKKEFFKSTSNQFVIKRPAQPQEIAQAAIYLMTNSFTTGSTLFVDGGYTFN